MVHSLKKFLPNKNHLYKIHSIVLKQIHNFYKQKAIEHGIKDPIPGAISFTQRFGSALNLNVHLHILFLDGVYTMVDEKPVFRNLLGISNDEVEETIAAIATKVIKYLQKQGYLDQDGEIVANPLMDDLFQDNEAMLLATTNSIAGKIAFGPNAGNSVTKIGSGFGYMEEIPFAKGDRCYSVNGFTLHAKTAVNSQSRDKLEKLISYISRGPIATERVTLTPDGQHILLQLKRPYDDGTTHLKFTPGEFIEKLVAIVPPPKTHLVRWSGCFASNSPIRSQIVLRPTVKKGFQFDEENPEKPKRVGWNEVLKHVFKIDVLVCTECGGTLKAVAAVRDPDQIARYLKHVGLGSDPPKLAVAKLQQGELNYELEH